MISPRVSGMHILSKLYCTRHRGQLYTLETEILESAFTYACVHTFLKMLTLNITQGHIGEWGRYVHCEWALVYSRYNILYVRIDVCVSLFVSLTCGRQTAKSPRPSPWPSPWAMTPTHHSYANARARSLALSLTHSLLSLYI